MNKRQEHIKAVEAIKAEIEAEAAYTYHILYTDLRGQIFEDVFNTLVGALEGVRLLRRWWWTIDSLEFRLTSRYRGREARSMERISLHLAEAGFNLHGISLETRLLYRLASYIYNNPFGPITEGKIRLKAN